MVYNQYRGLRLIKRSQWTERKIEDPESISEHTYSAWLLAMLFLPEEQETEGYSKREILDMLLVHDMAEGLVGDLTPVDGVPKVEKNRREAATMDWVSQNLLGKVYGGVAGKDLRDVWQEKR